MVQAARGARGLVCDFKLTSPFPPFLSPPLLPTPPPATHSNHHHHAAHKGMTTQSHDTLYSPVNAPQFLGEASGSATDTNSSNNTNLNAKRDDSTPFLTTPSATAMDSQSTPNPALAANVAADAMGVDAGTSTHDDEAATTTTSTNTTAPTATATATAASAAGTTTTTTTASTAVVAQQGETKEFYCPGDDDEEIVTLNLNNLLPKKTKHGRIGGSLYRALRDAGVDVAALGIPRGRPPRTVVGQKRPKRPTLLSLIKSGAELPMVPGAPRLRIVNIEMVPEVYEGEEGEGGGLQDLTNKQQRRRAGGRVSISHKKRKVGGTTTGNKRAKVAGGAQGAKQGGGGGGGGQQGPMEGLVADDEAATGLLLLLGETSS